MSGGLAACSATPPARCVSAELVMLLEWWSRTECTLFTDQATVRCLGKEHAVIILNHNFEIDFLCGWTMCERFGVLGVSDAGSWEGAGTAPQGGCEPPSPPSWEWEGVASPTVQATALPPCSQPSRALSPRSAPGGWVPRWR